MCPTQTTRRRSLTVPGRYYIVIDWELYWLISTKLLYCIGITDLPLLMDALIIDWRPLSHRRVLK
jgi:hypothetical protein